MDLIISKIGDFTITTKQVEGLSNEQFSIDVWEMYVENKYIKSGKRVCVHRCVADCNKAVKFHELLEQACKIGIEYLYDVTDRRAYWYEFWRDE